MKSITIPCENPGQISDGYHTFDELYQHRCALFLLVMKQVPSSQAWISQLHADGSKWPGWFIAGVNLPGGQITYHLPMSDWDLAVKTGATVLERGVHWGGHTPAHVVQRIREFVADPIL